MDKNKGDEHVEGPSKPKAWQVEPKAWMVTKLCHQGACSAHKNEAKKGTPSMRHK